MVKLHRARKVKQIERQERQEKIDGVIASVKNNFLTKSELELALIRFTNSICEKEEMSTLDVQKVQNIDGQIINFSNKLRSVMEWGSNSILDDNEVKVLFGTLNKEHDFLITRLEDLIKGMTVIDRKK